MKPHRKFPMSQLLTVKEIGGVRFTMYVMDDLNDEELQQQFTYYKDREDYEYLAEIVAEAARRELKLRQKNV
jgi:hypothetical protein